MAGKTKLITVYNAAEGRAYFLNPAKARNNVLKNLKLLGCDGKKHPNMVAFHDTGKGELPAHYQNAKFLDKPTSEAVWAAMKLYGFTAHYSRKIELPSDDAKKTVYNEQLKTTNFKPELLALDRTGISPVPLEIIFNTIMLYGQIVSKDELKQARAKEALAQFGERVTTYETLKQKLEQKGFDESDQLYRKVRRDYEFLRNMLMQINASANAISDIKKASNEKVAENVKRRDNALEPYADLKGNTTFRSVTAIAAFLIGGSAATYMASIKDELIKYFTNFTALPMTLFGVAMLGAATFAVAGTILFDAAIRFVENSISRKSARKIARISRNEGAEIRLVARRGSIFAIEQMAKYHYIEDLERSAPRRFVDMAVHEDWEGMQDAIRKADRYAHGGFIRRFFSTRATRELASVRPF